MRQRWSWRTGAALVIFLMGAVPAWAAEEPAIAPGLTPMELMRTGGIPMIALAVLSVAALAFILYLFVILRTESVFPRGFLRDLREAIQAERMEEARSICGKDRSAVAAIADVGLGFVKRHPNPDAGLLKEMIEGEGSRQAAQLQNQTQYLLDIAVIAPMVGLLGTVIGMLTAFNAVALDIAQARPMVLAGGVVQALITTAAGLIVGIPAMAFYAYFRGRVSKLVALLETGSAEIMTLLTERRP